MRVSIKICVDSLKVTNYHTTTQECKLSNPDYNDMGTDDAVNDFLQKIDHYCTNYQTIDEATEKPYSFMKIFDAGK